MPRDKQLWERHSRRSATLVAQQKKYKQRLSEDNDTATSLWALMAADKMAWPEYERRIAAVVKREEETERQAELLAADNREEFHQAIKGQGPRYKKHPKVRSHTKYKQHPGAKWDSDRQTWMRHNGIDLGRWALPGPVRPEPDKLTKRPKVSKRLQECCQPVVAFVLIVVFAIGLTVLSTHESHNRYDRVHQEQQLVRKTQNARASQIRYLEHELLVLMQRKSP